MATVPASLPPPAPAAVGRRPDRSLHLLAWLAVLWEQAWPALWPVTAGLLGFAVFALFDLPSYLPGWLHLALLLGFVGGIVWLAIDAIRGVSLPTPGASSRRLERDSGLAHRPLATLGDRPAAVDAVALAVWEIHQARVAASIRGLRLRLPRSGLLARDPLGLRAALGLLILVGWIGAGPDAGARLGRAFVPVFDRSPATLLTGLDLWITPPDYTGLPPIYFGTDATHPAVASDKPVPVPAGSTLLVQVHGGRRVPDLAIDHATTPLGPIAGGDYSATTKLVEGNRLTVTQSGTALARLDLAIVPDLPPGADFGTPPAVTPSGAIRLDYRATDDYGVTGLRLEIRRVGADDLAPIAVELPTAGNSRKELRGTSYQDLTAHPWAGLPVEMRLVATDATGQTGSSKPLRFTLPERQFHHPVAKAIIEQRKLLVTHPDQADVVAETLSDLSIQPSFFRNDFAVFMGLRTAVRDLVRQPAGDELAQTEQLMWEIALKVEDGNVPDAQKSLRAAQQALQDALARDASDAEIQKLMRDLRQAIQQYLQAMLENAQKNGEAQDQRPSDPSRTISPQDIDRMLKQAEQMSKSGAKDAARQALAQLQDMLESLKAGRMGQGRGGPGEQAMRQMQDLARRQQQLLDRSYRQNQRGASGQPGPPGKDGQKGQGRQSGASGEAGDLSGAQEGLRRQLDQLRRQLGQGGQAGQSLDRAERAMKDAVDALNRGQGEDAVGRQGDALDQLHEAARALGEQMRGQGDEEGEGEPAQKAGSDPFGRMSPGQGGVDRGDVQIPEQSEMQKSREILDELRRRAGERARPTEERDYIDRLLQRF
ncbi:MAG TPA: TIGR02302 family protein [Aliidongia sp.]|uniref:TIGR02302 family protein n=1 Tax=Aliidongia sp. TaxID=1914230 RepID=UPI002DDD62FE|nr:TIGR02302 family protein [Aliidongia sp.]HEV2677647.1 TIGR02302 family protein [Aliidongia sp.]